MYLAASSTLCFPPGPACLSEVACKTAWEDVCTVAKLSLAQPWMPDEDRCRCFLAAWTHSLPSSGYGLLYIRSKTSLLSDRVHLSRMVRNRVRGQQRIKLPASQPSCLHPVQRGEITHGQEVSLGKGLILFRKMSS